MMAPAPTSSSSGCRSGETWRDLYTTEVVAVGALVEEFVQAGVLVLFGEQAPAELYEFSVLHRPSVAEEGPAVGDIIVIDGTELPVLAVGEVVAGNLLKLGHLDIKADGNTEPSMPGDLCVPQGSLPAIAVGQTIRIVRPAIPAGSAQEGAQL
jgi:PTS system glucitol/sorbitol-specific IIA component